MSTYVPSLDGGEDKYVVCKTMCTWDATKSQVVVPLPDGHKTWDTVPPIDIWSLSIPFSVSFPGKNSQPVELLFSSQIHGPRIQAKIDEQNNGNERKRKRAIGDGNGERGVQMGDTISGEECVRPVVPIPGEEGFRFENPTERNRATAIELEPEEFKE